MALPSKEKTAQEMRDDALRADFRNKWRLVLTADEIYAQRDAAKGKK